MIDELDFCKYPALATFDVIYIAASLFVLTVMLNKVFVYELLLSHIVIVEQTCFMLRSLFNISSFKTF